MLTKKYDFDFKKREKKGKLKKLNKFSRKQNL